MTKRSVDPPLQVRARTKLSKDSKLTPTELLSFEIGIDVIGDIAILKLRPGMLGKESAVAEAIMQEMKNVRAVYGQEGGIEGKFRLRKLRHLGGDDRTTTVHRENGIQLRLDVESCYFSPRLSTERLRIAERVNGGENVLNMFAGVGPFSILIAKRGKRRGTTVCSCELNDAAFQFHLGNNKLNKVEENIEMVEGDALELPSILNGKGRFDRILMPHPSQSNLFLPTALALLEPGGVVHYYRHVTGRDVEEAMENLTMELEAVALRIAIGSVRRVRAIGPRYFELVADLKLS